MFYSAGCLNFFFQASKIFIYLFQHYKKLFFITNALAYHASSWSTELKKVLYYRPNKYIFFKSKLNLFHNFSITKNYFYNKCTSLSCLFMNYQIKKFYCVGHTNEIQKSKINLKNILTLPKILFITNAPAYLYELSNKKVL